MEYIINTDNFYLSGFIDDKTIPNYPDYNAFEMELIPEGREKYEIEENGRLEFSMDLEKIGKFTRGLSFSPKKKPWYQIQFLVKDRNKNYNQNYILINYEASDKEKAYIIKRIIFLFRKDLF